MSGLRALAFATPDTYLAGGPVATGNLPALTVECWARPDVIGAGNRPLLAQWPGWALYLTLDGRLALAVMAAGGDVAWAHSAPGAVLPGQWRHVAGCRDDAGRCRVLVHGADVTEDAASGPYPTAPQTVAAQIGGALYADLWPFVGRIGWTRVSAAARYGLRYVIPWQPPRVDAATVAQWNMQPAHGEALTVANATGAPEYTGQLIGATWTWGPLVGERRARVRERGALAVAARETARRVRRIGTWQRR